MPRKLTKETFLFPTKQRKTERKSSQPCIKYITEADTSRSRDFVCLVSQPREDNKTRKKHLPRTTQKTPRQQVKFIRKRVI